MTDELIKLDVFNTSMQVNADSVNYLGERLLELTESAEPDKDELKRCYYEAEHIAHLIITCADTLQEFSEQSEKAIMKLRL